MAIAGKITEYSYTYDGDTHKLFSKPAVLEGLIGALTEVGAVNPTPVTVAVGGHSRKRYPGGPTISVSAHSRERLLTGQGLQRTLPGANAYFEVEVSDGTTTTTEVTTVSFTGPFTALFMYCQTNAVADFVLRSPDGTPYPIADATP